MAQALARAGDVDLARRAYGAIPGKLDRMLPAGPWIRLYSSTSEAVLNAQLQSAISIAAYADIAGDTAAAAYAARLRATAKAMLPRFDTGHWSRYSLGAAAPGEDSTLEYHDYVVELLRTLKRTDGDDPVWDETLQRFQEYETEPPELTAPSRDAARLPRPRGRRPRRAHRPLLALEAIEGRARDRRQGGRRLHRQRRPPLLRRDAALRLRHARRAARRAQPRRPLRQRRRRLVRARARRDPADRLRLEGERPRLLAREGRRERVLPPAAPAPSRQRAPARRADEDEGRRSGSRPATGT